MTAKRLLTAKGAALLLTHITAIATVAWSTDVLSAFRANFGIDGQMSTDGAPEQIHQLVILARVFFNQFWLN